MTRTKVAVIGSGNIGTDLMIKVLRLSQELEMGAMVGIDPDSDGLRRAQRLGVPTTALGVKGLVDMPGFDDIAVVTRVRTCARAAVPSRSPTPLPARNSRATAWNGISLACDSQNVENTSIALPDAIAAISATRRLLPIPAGPTTPTTLPLPLIERSRIAPRALCSQSRPTRVVDARRPSRGCTATSSSRLAGTGVSAPFMCARSGSPSTATSSTSRAVDSLSITPPDGATDSIRWAIPTCSPIAV
jgi:hypothetical protein